MGILEQIQKQVDDPDVYVTGIYLDNSWYGGAVIYYTILGKGTMHYRVIHMPKAHNVPTIVKAIKNDILSQG